MRIQKSKNRIDLNIEWQSSVLASGELQIAESTADWRVAPMVFPKIHELRHLFAAF